ncbi:hypothetical protein V1J52_06050 [Streptomyces sp. TRM 70351]|uniref:hypothetical protein n=1 Tax=Streptomyces sp. TRM 70351 TaxID=3116552 RepID=UPI002E7BB6F6|nr:hypothetical protein [Streptomyces sp. TRM 70351]MEE1927756.1 hypothetical protein [Streptomyces sp. TRM 70351]
MNDARTSDTAPPARQEELADAVARAVEALPGVASLRPGPGTPPGALRDDRGVHVRHPRTGPGGPHTRVGLHLAVSRGHRALDVARAARAAAETAARPHLAPGAALTVSVTVTALD